MGDQKDNVKVAIRVRPLNEKERQETSKTALTIAESSKTISIEIQNKLKNFTFDYIADDSIDQREIFFKVGRPIADSCLSGYNGTIFAYGQTGAGKTFTILGPSLDSDFKFCAENSNRGLLPRCFEYIFSETQLKKSENPIEFSIKCSYLEIYQEQVNDLLDPNPQNLQLREDMKKGVYVEGLIEERVNSVAETYNLLRIGTQNRHVGSTSMNKESSRSHSVFILVIESKETRENGAIVISSKFSLIDLAGSERQKATDCAGERLKEAGMINKSLSALGNVINSLVDISEGKARHIHYRDSRLTFLLKDSLGGNSKTFIVANISPAFSAAYETLSTLKFVQRAKQIKNIAYINEEIESESLLKQEIRRLKECLVNAESKTCEKCLDLTNLHQPIEESIYSTLQQALKLNKTDSEIHRQQISAKDSIIVSLKSSVTKLEKKINHDKMILKFRDATIARLQNPYMIESDEVADLRAEIKCFKEEAENYSNFAKVFAENQCLRNDSENNKIMLAELERIKELEEISCRLAGELAARSKSDVGESEEKYLRLVKDYESLKDQYNEKENLVESLKLTTQHIINYQDHYNILLDQKETIKHEKENLKEINETLEEKIRPLLFENEEKSRDIQRLNDSLAELCSKFEMRHKEFTFQCDEKDKTIENLKESLEILKNDNSTLIEKLENKQCENDTTIESLRTGNEKLALKIQSLQADRRDLRCRLESAQQSLTTTLQSNNELCSEIASQKQAISDLEYASESLQASYNDLKTQLLNSPSITQSSSHLQITIDSLQSEIVRLESLVHKNSLLESKQKSFQSTPDPSIAPINFSAELSSLAAEYSNYKSSQSLKLSRSKSKILTLQQEFTKLKQANLSLESTIDLLTQDLKSAKQSLTSIQELNLSLAQKNAELSNSLGKMHTSHVPLYIVDQLRQELSDSQLTIASLKQENVKKLEILKSTKSSISSTKHEINMWKKCIDEKNNIIQDLRCELRKLSEVGNEVKYLRCASHMKEKEISEIWEKEQEYLKADSAAEGGKWNCAGLNGQSNWHMGGNKGTDSYKSRALNDNSEMLIKREDFFNLKNVNNKLKEELRINIEVIEELRKQHSDLAHKVNKQDIKRNKLEEEIENLTEGIAKITNFVFSLPAVNIDLEESSIVESTIQAIKHIYDLNIQEKRVLTDLDNRLCSTKSLAKLDLSILNKSKV